MSLITCSWLQKSNSTNNMKPFIYKCPLFFCSSLSTCCSLAPCGFSTQADAWLSQRCCQSNAAYCAAGLKSKFIPPNNEVLPANQERLPEKDGAKLAIPSRTELLCVIKFRPHLSHSSCRHICDGLEKCDHYFIH